MSSEETRVCVGCSKPFARRDTEQRTRFAARQFCSLPCANRSRRPPPRGCSADGCDGLVHCKELCYMHYSRQKRAVRGGYEPDLTPGPIRQPREPKPPYKKPTREEAFFANVTEDADGCWIRTPVNKEGYGKFWVEGRTVPAHRWAYEFLRAPIPDGLQIDHLCKQPSCVNPWHLEPVTPRVNLMRSTAVSAINAGKTHCFRGHPFAGDNLVIAANGSRRCRTCLREWTKARQRKAAS